MKVPEDMGMSMADGVNGGGRRGLSRQSRSQSRLVNLIDALVGIDSTKEDPFMLLTIRPKMPVPTSSGGPHQYSAYQGMTSQRKGRRSVALTSEATAATSKPHQA